MGFTTGFIGGFTLTSSLVYLSLTIHQQNRLRQALTLRQSSILLNGVTEPDTIPREFTPPSAREHRAGLADTAKDGWNRRVEAGFRWMQDMDWQEVRQEAEGKAGRAWRRVRESIGGEGSS